MQRGQVSAACPVESLPLQLQYCTPSTWGHERQRKIEEHFRKLRLRFTDHRYIQRRSLPPTLEVLEEFLLPVRVAGGPFSRVSSAQQLTWRQLEGGEGHPLDFEGAPTIACVRQAARVLV